METDPRFEFREAQDKLFCSKTSRPATRPTPPPSLSGYQGYFPVVKRPGLKSTIHIQLTVGLESVDLYVFSMYMPS